MHRVLGCIPNSQPERAPARIAGWARAQRGTELDEGAVLGGSERVVADAEPQQVVRAPGPTTWAVHKQISSSETEAIMTARTREQFAEAVMRRSDDVDEIARRASREVKGLLADGSGMGRRGDD